MRLVRLLPAAVILGVTAITLVRLHTAGPLSRPSDSIVSETLPRLAFLRDSLEHGSVEQMREIFPEGYPFSFLLYGLSWVQVGFRSPPDSGLRSRAVTQARWALSHVDSSAGRAVFDSSLDPPYAAPRTMPAEESTWPNGFWRVPWYAAGYLAVLLAATIMGLRRRSQPLV